MNIEAVQKLSNDFHVSEVSVTILNSDGPEVESSAVVLQVGGSTQPPLLMNRWKGTRLLSGLQTCRVISPKKARRFKL
jgi:hypothetical protein